MFSDDIPDPDFSDGNLSGYDPLSFIQIHTIPKPEPPCNPTAPPPQPTSPPSSSSSSKILSNQDLLTEILLYLPPKTLLRSQTVSLQWRSLISNPLFRRLYSRRHRNNVAGLFFFRILYGHREFKYVPFDNHNEENMMMNTVTWRFENFRIDDRHTTITDICSCKGIFCIQLSLVNYEYFSTKFCVYNPVTNQHSSIPDPIIPSKNKPLHVKSMNLAFDPLGSDHYKLVCLWDSFGEDPLLFSVYSSETGDWSFSDETLTRADSYLLDRGLFWNGSIHWVSETEPFLCFDVENLGFKPMPSTTIRENQEGRNIQYFGESGGLLHLIEMFTPLATSFDILQLESNYREWSVKYRVDLDALTVDYPLMVNEDGDPSDMEERCAFRVVCFLVDHEKDRALLVISLPCRLHQIFLVLHSPTNGDACFGLVLVLNVCLYFELTYAPPVYILVFSCWYTNHYYVQSRTRIPSGCPLYHCHSTGRELVQVNV